MDTIKRGSPRMAGTDQEAFAFGWHDGLNGGEVLRHLVVPDLIHEYARGYECGLAFFSDWHLDDDEED